MGKVKEAFESVFPMPAHSSDSRIRALEDSLQNILAAQEELAARLERLQETAEETRDLQKKAQGNAAEGTHALDVWGRVQYPKLMTVLGGLAEQIDRGREADSRAQEAVQEALDTLEREVREITGGDIFRRIEYCQEKLEGLECAVREITNGDIFRRIEYCQEKLEELEQAVREITDGDIFRRIEFTQGRIIWLESLLQKNMLSRQEQQGSSEYKFILRMRALFPLLEVRTDKPFVRIGRHHDGGYVMLDDFEGRSAAYSIGIADDVSWDRDIAARGLNVYMYDHTIEGLPEENERFHFSRTGIGAKGGADDPRLKTLPEMMADNGHLDTYGMILKIDVEGAEWAVLRQLDEEVLKHFSQIVFEFHGLTDMKNEDDIRPAMEKLNRTHQLVHLHANNYGTYRLLGGAILPELLEGTYLLKSEYEFEGKPESVSTELDEINCPYLADIHLGIWDV